MQLFLVLPFFDQVPNKGSAILNPCQSWTKMEESRLWGSYLGWVHCKSPNLLQPSLAVAACIWRDTFGTIPLLRQQKTGWVGSENDNFCRRSVLYLFLHSGWVKKSPTRCWRNGMVPLSQCYVSWFMNHWILLSISYF